MTEDSKRRSLEGMVVIENQWFDDWTKANIPDQSGKVAIVTGSNSGTGFWCASALAGAGATVVLACRTVPKAEAAKKDILKTHPTAKVDVIPLDTSDLQIVRDFAKTFDEKYDRLDILCNNAGIMALPYSLTKDGYEIQFQTNHLGHFLLTKLLWKKLVDTEGQGRIVQHSSGAHSFGSPYFDKNHMQNPKAGISGIIMKRTLLPLMGMSPMDNWGRYGVSKLCNVLFMKSLAQKIETGGLTDKVLSVACHPGYANTGLQKRAGDAGSMANWEKSNASMSQSAADGSLSLLMCCVGKDLKNGSYFGPSLKMRMVGPPSLEKVGGYGNDQAQADAVWDYSEECIKEKFVL